MTQQQLYLEATLEATEEKTGREWEVTIIGARTPDDIVTVDGRTYIRSKNGRLYSTSAIAESAAQWDGVKVYDNHLTQEEFERKQGMRSPSKEWLGTLVKPRWDSARNKLLAIFKVVEDSLAKKLKNAHDANVLGAIGLSIDTFPDMGSDVVFEGVPMPTIEGFKKILSVDLVGDPAAGGGFERLIAAATPQDVIKGANQMDETKLEELFAKLDAKIDGIQLQVPALVRSTIAESLAADVEEEQVQESEEEEAVAEETVQAAPVNTEANDKAETALQEARAARFELLLGRKLEAAKLTDKGRAVVEAAFEGRIVEGKEVMAMIEKVRATEAANDTSGRVTGAGGQRQVESVWDEKDKAAMMFMYKIAGRSVEGLENHADDRVQERAQESESLQAWKNAGKPNLRFDGRMSELIRTQFLNGGWTLDSVNYQEALSLATVIKNTVNIMTAVDYAGQNRWYEQLVDEEVSDNPIDDFTFARLFGADSLDVVPKGSTYTEMQLQDEEETASHVKQGNYVAVHLEDLLADKITYFRNLPTRLADAWYNTLSAKVAGVFTTNTNAGPVLSDTGALFNATAATSAGGHANLLTTALSHSQFDTVINAMYAQTSRPLGTGRKLVDMGPFTLLVPVGLRTTANQIRNSEFVPSTSASVSAINPYYQGVEVVQVPDWTDANDWAVLARYRGKSPIKLVFPSGMRTPQVVAADAEVAGSMFTNDTIRYKLRMMTYRFSDTYDVAPVVDWRLLHKSNVA
jgi:hypothetical protein